MEATTAARTVCRHCGVKPVTRPRGLCWKDFRLHRDLYPVGSANPATAHYAVAGAKGAESRGYQCVHCEATCGVPGPRTRAGGWADQRVRLSGLWVVEVCCPLHAALGFPPVVPWYEHDTRPEPLPEEWAPARRATDPAASPRAGWVAAGGGRRRA